jgi:predicted transcriptional regulator
MKRKEKGIHIGNVIREVLKNKGIKTVWLAEKLDYHSNSLYKILRKSSKDCKLIRNISDNIGFEIYNYWRELEKKQDEEQKKKD